MPERDHPQTLRAAFIPSVSSEPQLCYAVLGTCCMMIDSLCWSQIFNAMVSLVAWPECSAVKQSDVLLGMVETSYQSSKPLPRGAGPTSIPLARYC